MSTCNRLDFQTLGSQLVMLKNLPDNCKRWSQKFSLDVCLTLRSMVSRVASLLLSINVCLQIKPKMVTLQRLKSPFPIIVENVRF